MRFSYLNVFEPCQADFTVFLSLSITVFSVLFVITFLCALVNSSMESHDVCPYHTAATSNMSLYAGRWRAKQEERRKVSIS